MTRVGIITALKLEARPLARHPVLAVRVCGVAGPGIGDAVRELAEHGSRLMVSWGTAGAVSPRLRAGDLILPERVVARNGGMVYTDDGSREGFRRAMDGSWPVVSGTLLESDRVLAAPGDKRSLGRGDAFAAVDMESGRIGEACAALGLPFLVIRAIIDEVDDRLPRLLTEHPSPGGSLRRGALLAGLLRPGDWMALARLVRRYRRARAGLDAAARVLAGCAAGRP